MALTKVPSNLDATVAITQSASDNSTNVATTAYVTTALANLVDGAPSTLNTLDEIAAALNDDAALNTTLTTSIATKLPLAGGTLTGDTSIIKSGNPSFTVKTTGAGNNPFIRIQADTNYWDIQSLFSNTEDELDFRYNGTSKLIIDNTGNVGIGESSPTSKLHIKTSAAMSGSGDRTNSTNAALIIQQSASNSHNRVIHLSTSSTVSTVFNFETSKNAYWGETSDTGSYFFRGRDVLVESKLAVASSVTPNGTVHIGTASAEGSQTAPALQIGGSTTYRLGLYTTAEQGIIENKNGDSGLSLRVKTAGEILQLETTGKIKLASGSHIEKDFRNLYTDSSTATQYMKIYDKAGATPPKYLHFLMYAYNHSEFSAEVKIHIPTYSGFVSGYGSPDDGMGPTVEIDCGGLPNQSKVFNSLIVFDPANDSANFTEIWLKITPPNATTNIVVREFADSDPLIQTTDNSGWTTTVPTITRSFEFAPGHRTINNLAIGRNGNVGINTAKNDDISPQKALHVEHAGGASEGILISGNSDTTGHTAGILLRAEGGEQDSSLRAKGGIFFERTGTYGVGKLHLANDTGADNNSAVVADAKLTIQQAGGVTLTGNHQYGFRANGASNPGNGADIVFDAVRQGNAAGCYSTSSGAYQAQIAGWHMFSVGIRYDTFGSTSGAYIRPQLRYLPDGSSTWLYPHTGGWVDPIFGTGIGNSSYVNISYTVPMLLGVGDQVRVFNNGNVSNSVNHDESHFGCIFMG